MTKPSLNVKKGDTVVVVTGKDAGHKGKIIEVLPNDSRVVVEGVNVVKRHTKPTQEKPQGGILDKEAAIHSSNVMMFCAKCDKPTRVGKKLLDNGDKSRYCKKCGEVLD